MNLVATLVWWAAAPAPGAGGGLGMLLPILLFIPLLYLLMIRPQQKRHFGFLGAGVPMVLLGWGIGRLSRWTDVNYKVWKLGLVAIVLVPLLMYARAEAGNVLRGVVWYAGIPYFMVRLWPKRPLHWH